MVKLFIRIFESILKSKDDFDRIFFLKGEKLTIEYRSMEII